LCQEVKSLTSAKTSRLRSHAHCGVQSFTSCPEAFHDGEEILQDAGLLHMMEKNLLADFPCKRNKETAAAKKKNNNNKKLDSNKQSIHARKTR